MPDTVFSKVLGLYRLLCFAHGQVQSSAPYSPAAMIPDKLPLLPLEAVRIPFACASARQVAQALAYATERLAAHFPALDWVTWSDAFQHVKPELVVQGPAVWLEWPVLARLVQHLAMSVNDPVAAELAEQALAYQDLTHLEEALEGSSPPLCELVATLARDHATAARFYAATHEPAAEQQIRPDLPVLNQQPASVASASLAVESAVGELALPSVAAVPAAPGPAQTPEPRLLPARRTFRDIVQYHPRANGKRGFTVRELCRAMRISAASLRDAHAHPGRLSLKAVNALATLMQEPLLPVLADLLAGAEISKKRRAPNKNNA